MIETLWRTTGVGWARQGKIFSCVGMIAVLMRKPCTLHRHGHASMTQKGVARELKGVSFQPGQGEMHCGGLGLRERLENQPFYFLQFCLVEKELLC